MCNENKEEHHFLITHKEEELLRQLRKLSEKDRNEVEQIYYEIITRYADMDK